MTKKQDEAYDEAVNLTRRNALAKGATALTLIFSGCYTVGNSPEGTPTDEETPSPTPSTDTPTPTERPINYNNDENTARIKAALSAHPQQKSGSGKFTRDVIGLRKVASLTDDLDLKYYSFPQIKEIQGVEAAGEDVKFNNHNHENVSSRYQSLFDNKNYDAVKSLNQHHELVSEEENFEIFSLDEDEDYLAFDSDNKVEVTSNSLEEVRRIIQSDDEDQESALDHISDSVVSDFIDENYILWMTFGMVPPGSEMDRSQPLESRDYSHVIYRDPEDEQFYEQRFVKWSENSSYGSGWEKEENKKQKIKGEWLHI